MSKNPEDPQQILKRIEQQSQQKKRLATHHILNRSGQVAHKPMWWQKFVQQFQVGYYARKKEFIKMARVNQNKHIVIITLFLTAVMWVSWKIEDKYDRMRRRIHGSKSQKESQIENESQYIQKMLAKNPFQPVPIEDQQEEKASYIFEKAEIEFDTRADLLQILEEERRLMGDENELL